MKKTLVILTVLMGLASEAFSQNTAKSEKACTLQGDSVFVIKIPQNIEKSTFSLYSLADTSLLGKIPLGGGPNVVLVPKPTLPPGVYRWVVQGK